MMAELSHFIILSSSLGIYVYIFSVCVQVQSIYTDLYNNISPRGVFGVCPRSAEDIEMIEISNYR